MTEGTTDLFPAVCFKSAPGGVPGARGAISSSLPRRLGALPQSAGGSPGPRPCGRLSAGSRAPSGRPCRGRWRGGAAEGTASGRRRLPRRSAAPKQPGSARRGGAGRPVRYKRGRKCRQRKAYSPPSVEEGRAPRWRRRRSGSCRRGKAAPWARRGSPRPRSRSLPRLWRPWSRRRRATRSWGCPSWPSRASSASCPTMRRASSAW